MKLKYTIILFAICAFIIIFSNKYNKIGKTEPIVIEEKLVLPPQKEEIKEEEILDIALKYCDSYEEALLNAKKYKRPIFIYFGATWCGYCVKMTNETLNEAEVKDKLSKEYIVYIVDTDIDKNTTKKFKISGIPQYVIINDDESIELKAAGFKPKQEFLSWLSPKNVSLIH